MVTFTDKRGKIVARFENFESFKNFENFEDTIARLERDAQTFLGKENCPPAVSRNEQEPGSEAWVRFRFLIELRLIRAAIDRNEPALVFQLALQLGALLERFDVINAYTPDIIRGGKLAQSLQGTRERANAERALGAAEEHAEWQRQAEEVWSRNRHLSKPAVAKFIAKHTDPPRSANTIRQHIKKPDEAG